jgi:pimeloyl-ACP methyl ester carboxylesterase
MSKPSILLAPYSYGLPEFYDQVFDVVRAKGYDIRGLHLPSVGLRTLEGRSGKSPTMYDDADYIAQEVEKLADTGKDVVLIGHSYSGTPVSQCGKGLSKDERGTQGKPGGLVNLAYLSCPVPPLGGHANSFRAEVQDEHIIDMKIDLRHSLLEAFLINLVTSTFLSLTIRDISHCARSYIY